MGGEKALQRGARVEAVAYVRIASVSIPDAVVQTSATSEAQAMRLSDRISLKVESAFVDDSENRVALVQPLSAEHGATD